MIVTPWVFLFFTVILMGGAGYMTGQALATTWRPVWQVVAYTLLLGLVDRFLVFALFNGLPLSMAGYILDTSVIAVIALCSYRFTRVRRMIGQYPWLYERAGIFFWREKTGSKAA
jgi:hypothetical protein